MSEKDVKYIKALELAKGIIGYVGFDSWEMECLREDLREFDDLCNELKIK